jgi:hypothetical protein
MGLFFIFLSSIFLSASSFDFGLRIGQPSSTENRRRFVFLAAFEWLAAMRPIRVTVRRLSVIALLRAQKLDNGDVESRRQLKNGLTSGQSPCPFPIRDRSLG